ncbi:MAG TPA: 16S rRNA (cytosine(967)-C(5))-methyltransferase RsmB, partial [Rhodanobacteraceae bacterium]|nr:16S rRNA (cytosine(967)-C(5))-methyltransferase RsmB [Rhodanobacteraceae bacterium]
VNAVLRRWLREREAFDAQLEREPQTRTAHPRWLIEAIARDWPERADSILAADNTPAPPMLRVNRRRATRDETIASLLAKGLNATAHAALRDALVLDENTDVARLPEFAQGKLSVQDGAAQFAPDLLEARNGMRVLDACAAPGGKTCHLLERSDVDLLSLEREPSRATRIRENLQRLGLRCELRIGDAGDPEAWWDGKLFDRILLDAPCSATGVIRRHPDIKLHRRADDVPALARGQSRLLTALWPLLKPGGRLLYATCSILRAENDDVVEAFLAANDDAQAEPFAMDVSHPCHVGRQILPGMGGLDGMYYAALGKRH